jgi:hypothetical protein
VIEIVIGEFSHDQDQLYENIQEEGCLVQNFILLIMKVLEI